MGLEGSQNGVQNRSHNGSQPKGWPQTSNITIQSGHVGARRANKEVQRLLVAALGLAKGPFWFKIGSKNGVKL